MEILFSAIAFLAGAALDRAYLNRGWDSERCEKVKEQIDEIVGHFHERFSQIPERRKNATTLFDYEIKSLVDDTTLLPVIGRRAYDGEYIRLISRLYKLSEVNPETVTDEARSSLLASIDKCAIDLKKVISSNQKQLRFFNRD